MRGLLFIFACLLLFDSLLFAQEKKVLVIGVDGTINPASSDYIESGINRAKDIEAACLIIELNTPGGLLKSTREIVKNILLSPVPVVVYVYPSGSQAASAGVFITLAGHIAAMAPGTNIGAAHPVTLQGQQDSVMMEKATNDAAAFIRTISEKRNRNVKWAEEAVRHSLSITETEALKNNIIDLIAPDLRNLLKSIDGKEIELPQGKIELQTENALTEFFDMTIKQKILNVISDPNIAYILFMLGIYGLLFELYNPGSIFPGVIGVISLILAFYSLNTLPVNYAGLALIIFGIILFILEVKIVSHGLLSIGGTISLILGSIMLIDVESALEAASISWEVIILITGLTLLFFLFAIGLGIKAQKRKPATGAEGLIGEEGVTISRLDPEGQVKVHGEIWQAESSGEIIEKGEKIIVAGVSHFVLKVKTKNK